LWGATITAIGNGNWTTNSTWSCNCQPTSSDNIVIPAGRTVTANGPVILFLGPVITITISGTLILNNASLQIDSSDRVDIMSGGKITGAGLLGGAVYSGVIPIFVSSGSSIDGPRTISNGVLPITLIYFRSATKDDGILLEWASAEELNFDYYEIGRSIDGKTFVSTAIVKGKGDGGAEYSFIDSSPSEGTNYYKLTAVDLDGSREEFQVVKGEWEGFRDWISVFPNPVTDGTIHALFFGGGSGSFRLLNSNGTVVAESSFGNAFACNLHLPTTAGPGIYFVHAEVDGRVAQIKVIIK
jgi:hypothetical protein